MEAPSLEVHKAAGKKQRQRVRTICPAQGVGQVTSQGRRLRTSMTRRDVFHQAPTGEHRMRCALQPPPPPTAAIVLSQYTTQETVPFTSRDRPWLLAASERREDNISPWTRRVPT